jgi:hypothetical protein
MEAELTMEIDLNAILEKVQGEISFVNSTLKDKGSNRFSRPLAIGGFLVFGAYWFVYTPPAKKLEGLTRRIDTAKATAQFADAYKDVKARLHGVYPLLPRPNQPSLTASVVETLRLENIIPDSLMPPAELEVSGLLVQSVTVSMTVNFAELTAWILRVEAHRPAFHLSSLNLRKKNREKYEVQVVVSTILPKVRY